MRITSKGQVTIPQEIRERAGLLPNTEVEFDFDGKSVRLRRAAGGSSGRGRGASAIARLRRTAGSRLSTDQIMAMTRAR